MMSLRNEPCKILSEAASDTILADFLSFLDESGPIQVSEYFSEGTDLILDQAENTKLYETENRIFNRDENTFLPELN